MTINFNGTAIDIATEMNVAKLLQLNDVVDGRFVVVVNDEIVPKSEYDSAVITTGDEVEIMSPITGG
ncbi:thiamine biosynthesis protein ThiS [Methylophaga sp. 41_12_T18]|nr:thiamine biosynthesis protein ThiS [Methylophaga sp. 41_12_T18]